MLDAARYDDEFAGLDPFRLLASVFAIVHPKATLHDQKHLVFIFVMMPGEWPFELDELDELAVEFAGDARVPVVVDERKFLGEIDLVHCKNVSEPRAVATGSSRLLEINCDRAEALFEDEF